MNGGGPGGGGACSGGVIGKGGTGGALLPGVPGNFKLGVPSPYAGGWSGGPIDSAPDLSSGWPAGSKGTLLKALSTA
jgi:hypothetical protein